MTDKIKVISPLTLDIIFEINTWKKDELLDNLQKVKKEQKKWKEKNFSEKEKILLNWLKIIENKKEEIAHKISLEIGKKNKDALEEIERSIKVSQLIIEEAKRLDLKVYTGKVLNLDSKKKFAIYERQARGIVMIISPFNYPINTALTKIIAALITGNGVIWKPSTQGMMTAIFISNLKNNIQHFPSSILKIVICKGKDVSKLLVSNKNINVISFTGSTTTGNLIARKTKKAKLILEMGGKDAAFIVDDNNDMNKIANKIIKGSLNYSGQRCTAIKRVIILEKIANKFVKTITNKLKKLFILKKIDDLVVPLINIQNAIFAEKLIEEALTMGAKLIIGKKRKDNYFPPTLIDNVSENMRIAKEEQFAPIIPIIRTKTIKKGINIINKSNYGLQTSVFTKNINLAFQIAQKIEVGTVNINEISSKGPDNFPFVGIKDSGGLDSEGIKNLLLNFTIEKGIVFNWEKQF